MAERHPIRLRPQWSRHVKSGVLHAIALAGVVVAHTRELAAGRRRLLARLEQATMRPLPGLLPHWEKDKSGSLQALLLRQEIVGSVSLVGGMIVERNGRSLTAEKALDVGRPSHTWISTPP